MCRRFQGTLVLAACLPLLLACASTDMKTDRRFVSERELSRPPVIFVYDFAVSRADVVVDQAGLAAVSGEAPVNDRDDLAHEVASVLAETMVGKLREKEIEAEHADPAMNPPLHALLVKGEFRSIDEGDQMARVTLGFGAGKSNVEVAMTLFRQTALGAQLLATGDAEASGSKMPGMLIPVGAGATLGRAATSAVVSGTMTGLRELKGPLGKDLTRIAEEFADRAEALYERRGWR